MNIILAECQRQFTSHVRVTVSDEAEAVSLEYGHMDALTNFQPLHSERITYQEYPELRNLRSEKGWNWREFWNLVVSAECANIGTPLRVFLQEGGMWRERAVIHQEETTAVLA